MNHLHTDEMVNGDDMHKRAQGAPRRAATLIYNPAAGFARRRKRRLMDVIEALNRRGAIVTLRETARPGDAEAFAREAATRGTAEIVIAAGGDGTINEVANGLVGTRVPLGVVPLGTANVLALEVSLPRRADALAELLLTGTPRDIGAGRVNKRFFLLWVGAGFDGQLVHAIDPQMKKRFGKLAFIWAGTKMVLFGQRPVLRVDDGTQQVTCGWVVVANAMRYAGPYRLAPSCRFDEVGLSTICVPARSGIGLTLALCAMALGLLERLPGVTVLNGHTVTISNAAPSLDDGAPVQVDGDDMLTLPVRIECWDTGKAPQIRLVMP